MAQPKVSIIVPVYNAEKHLDRCLNSLKNQTLKEIEIILVDDASPDSSGKICDLAAEEDARIRVIHKENEGAGLARNAALAIARGEYVGFVDSDDQVEKTMFQVLYQAAEECGADLVLSGTIFVDGNMFSQKGECEEKSYFQAETLFQTKEELAELRMGIVGAKPYEPDDSKYGMSVWKNLFRKEIIDQAGLRFHSERKIFSEDAMFMMDYISHIQKAVGIPGAYYRYYRNDGSVSKSHQSDRLEKGLAFLSEVEKNFEVDLRKESYEIYLDRFWQAFCRVLCSQELMYAKDQKKPFSATVKRLEAICTHPRTQAALQRYPLGSLPVQQRIFALAMKKRWYFLLKILVGLKNR